MRQSEQGKQGERGEQRAKALTVPLFALFALFAPLTPFALFAQTTDPRPNECWGFVFGAWSPALDWTGAGHAPSVSRAGPPSPEASTTGGAPRHDAASYERSGGPVLILYPTWWPVGVGITLERQPTVGDTVSGVAHAFVADGRLTPPESRILAWRKSCDEAPAPATRAAPDERRSLPAARASARPPARRAGRPR